MTEETVNVENISRKNQGLIRPWKNITKQSLQDDKGNNKNAYISRIAVIFCI